MRRPSTRRILPPVAVALAVAGAYGLSSYHHTVALGPGARGAPPRTAAVTAVTRACPMPGAMSSTGVAVVAAPATSGAGRAAVSPLSDPAASPLFTVTRPGRLTLASVKDAGTARHAGASGGPATVRTVPARGGVVIRATGSLARGLEAEQTGPGATPSARCGGPGTDFWFVGPGQQAVGRIQLFLMNVDRQPADVSAEISTDAGPLQGRTDTGIAVPPHSMVVQSLNTILHGSHVMALHVRTTVGQVVAAVEETKGASRSGSWLPPAQQPATRVLLPGFPSAPGTREIYLAVPGAQDARIHLTAITTRGSYQPTGGTGLDIPGGSAVSIALPSMSGIPAAIKISSSVPVTASAMLAGGPRGGPGVFTAACGPVLEQGVVADNHTGAGATSELVLSAPAHAVRARVTRIAAGGAGKADGGSDVTVRAHHSLVVQLRRMAGSGPAFAVMITPLPGSGPLYAGRVVQTSGAGGRVESIVPVVSALTTVPLPPVRAAFISAVP